MPETARLSAVATRTWRVVIALARFGGLRCPSEVLMLKWSDVDLAGGRMLIPVEKFAHIPGRETRECPVFAALRPHLEEAFELAAPGEVYVVGGVTGDTHRKASRRPGGWVNANLRTTFAKVVRRAGLTQWPRLFQNLRASCETDLLSEYPIASVTAWIGHSAEVALKHYSQVRSADFDRAAGREKAVQNPVQSAAKVVQNAVQSGNDLSELEPTSGQKPPEMSAQVRSSADRSLLAPVNGVTLRGFDAPGGTATNPGTSAILAEDATQNPTHAPERDALAAFVASLTPEQRAKLAALLTPGGSA